MPRDKLMAPKPLQTLKFLFDNGHLELNPDYQREAVWTREQRRLLIDSLLQGLDVPKLYFRLMPSGNFEVVDGQQRLRAVFEFIGGNLQLAADQDPVDGLPTAGKRFDDLDVNLQIRLLSTCLDIVELRNYSDDDVEEMFLRLQNGTPLNAAEKRRALRGNMRTVVEALARHRVFELAGFRDTRYAFQDAAAKALHLLLSGGITSIAPASVEATYLTHAGITERDPHVVRLNRAYNFLRDAFLGKDSPRFKKHAFITVPYLVVEMLGTYDLAQHGPEFADAYLAFETARIEDGEKPEGDRDPRFAAYTNAARSDQIPDMTYRYGALRDAILDGIPDLTLLDPTRTFSDEQRFAIFRKNKGVCQGQGCDVVCDQSDFHADHILPHSLGGATRLSNGQVLCASCNLRKGNQVS